MTATTDAAGTVPLVRVDDADAVRTIRLDSPGNRNALSLAMLDALTEALSEAEDDTDVHAVVIAATGPVFSAGHDLRELRAADSATAARIFGACAELMLRISSLRVPVIAAVGGVATAAGCQLVATCDLAVAGESARFATPGVDIGLFCTTPMVALSRSVAPKHAMEMLLTGRPIDAATAERIGLVNRVVPDDRVAEEAHGLAALVAAKPSAVVSAGKATRRLLDGLPLRAAYDVAGAAMVEGLAGRDAIEGIGAFLDKRPPKWNG